MTGYGEATSVPAGWYLDPSNDSFERYWDGEKWTPRTREHSREELLAPLTPPANTTPLAKPGEALRVGAAIGDPYGFYQVPEKARFRKETSTSTVRAPGIPHLIISLIVGAIFLGVGYYLHTHISLPAGDTASATATITSLNTPIGATTPNHCRATMTFTANGQEYVSKVNISHWPCSVKIGQAEIVHFNPSNPTTAALAAPGFVQVLGWVCVGFGCIVMMLGFARLFA